MLKRGLLLLLILPLVYSQECSTAPGGLCEGYDEATCTQNPSCDNYPSCLYSGRFAGYICQYDCWDTGLDCFDVYKCVCKRISVCSYCTAGGPDLNACSNSGCGPSDSTPPTVTITSPTSSSAYTTSVTPLSLKGTASDDNTVVKVWFENDRNAATPTGHGDTDGTEQWTASYINLEPGANVITVSARDGQGNIGTDTLAVTYNPSFSQTQPQISLSETSGSFSVTISDPDAVTSAYAWAEMPTVYFLIPFASDSNPLLSVAEQERLAYTVRHVAEQWDIITENKHPLRFVFPQPYVVSDYTSPQSDIFQYWTRAIREFNKTYGSPQEPYIYVFLYPEPYSTSSGTNMWSGKEQLAEVYMANFNDAVYSDPNEIFLNMLLHELAHDFIHLPNNEDIPEGQTLFWLDHPAGFAGSPEPCSEDTFLYDCKPYGVSQSPTGQEGYYEAYSLLSLIRIRYTRENLGGRYPELSPMEQMALGIRSKYDDAPYMFYSGRVSYSGGYYYFTENEQIDYGISSRRLTEYNLIEGRPSIYWDIRFDSPKTSMGSSKSFEVQKSSQQGRALIVYAEDAQNPGHFRVFGNNAASPVEITDDSAPGAVAGLTASGGMLSWSPASDNMGIGGYEIERDGQVVATVVETFYTPVSGPATYTVVPIDLAGNRGPSRSTQAAGSVHDADTDADGCVSLSELIGYIADWKGSGSISVLDVRDAIDFWLTGCD